MVEYILLVALLVLGVVAGVKVLGFALGEGFDTLGGAVDVVADGIENSSTGSAGANTISTNASGAPSQAGRLRTRTCMGRHDFVADSAGNERCRDCGTAP